MAALDVGWSDIGSWPALLDVLGAPGVDGGVVEAGERVEAAARRPAGRNAVRGGLVVRGADGTIIVQTPSPSCAEPATRDRSCRSSSSRCAAAEARP